MYDGIPQDCEPLDVTCQESVIAEKSAEAVSLVQVSEEPHHDSKRVVSKTFESPNEDSAAAMEIALIQHMTQKVVKAIAAQPSVLLDLNSRIINRKL